MRDALRLVVLAIAVRTVALSLRLFGYARTSQALREGVRPLFAKRGLTPSRSPQLVAARVARAATTGPLPVGCLPRALLTAAILEGRGVEVAVRIGVRRDGDAFSAHAWVEHDGVPIAEPEEVAARFAAFDRDFRDGAAIRP